MANLLTAFRKCHSTQDALLKVIESWPKSLGASGTGRTVLVDLYRSYHCFIHYLMIAKLEAYGFDRDSLKLVYYLRGREPCIQFPL